LALTSTVNRERRDAISFAVATAIMSQIRNLLCSLSWGFALIPEIKNKINK
jgi:hypothetical protein